MAKMPRSMLKIDGPKLREIRLRRLLTIAELAEQADLDPAHLGVIERSAARPVQMRTIRNLSRVLEVDANEFLHPVSPDSLGVTAKVIAATAAPILAAAAVAVDMV